MKAKNMVKLELLFPQCKRGVCPGGAGRLLAQADPTVPELADVKTAVSEAVTNCIVHAYPQGVGLVHLSVALYDEGLVRITVADKGVGIPDVEKAMQPMFTTGNPEERAGLGFAVMQSFMDKVRVTSSPGKRDPRGDEQAPCEPGVNPVLTYKREGNSACRPNWARGKNLYKTIWGWCTPARGDSGQRH